ncbi:MAG: hypothetical protein V4598_07245 [Bdellovibrionota bacterium]
MEPKEGVYLSSEVNGKTVYADYFPHIPLGDEPVTQFLAGFQKQETEYQRKMLKLLHSDAEFQSYPAKRFRNHQLWTGSEEIVSHVVKYKMLHPQDKAFHEALKRGVRVRLDANAMFNKSNMNELLDSLTPEWHKLIDYVEDPLSDIDWSTFPLKRARDFILGTPFDLYVYKPNCEMRPDFSEIIYSAYLGSALGSWHTYCELISSGNTSIVQGIIGQGFYEEVKDFYLGDYDSGFIPDLTVIKEMYADLRARNWEDLCSM